MAQVRFRVHPLGYAEHPSFGSEHILARFRNKEFTERFPSLTEHDLKHAEDSHYLRRERLTSYLASYNEGIGNRLAPSTIEALNSNGRLILSGQQAGLLLGPLYTFLKIVTVIGLTKQLQTRAEYPVIPGFWIASEDHDVEEVNRVTIGASDYACPYQGKLRSGATPPVGAISVTACREELLAFLHQSLPGNEFREWLMDLVAASDFSDYSRLFATLFGKLFREWSIVLIDALGVHSLCGDVMGAIVRAWPELTIAFDDGNTRLESYNVTPPLKSLQLFEIQPNARLKCQEAEQKFVISGVELSLEEAAVTIQAHPERFSPGAALRPVVQDAVLPVLAYIAGPTELAYLWQIEELYQTIAVPRSRIVPRISATFLERKIAKSAANLGLTPVTSLLIRQLDAASHLPKESGADLVTLSAAGETLLSLIRELPERENERWVEKTEQSIAYNVARLVTKLKENRLAAVGQGRQQVEKVRNALYPKGKPQERVQSLFYFLGYYGPGFITQAVATLDPTAPYHHLVELVTDEGDA